LYIISNVGITPPPPIDVAGNSIDQSVNGYSQIKQNPIAPKGNGINKKNKNQNQHNNNWSGGRQ